MRYVAVMAAVAVGYALESGDFGWRGPGVGFAGAACYLIGRWWPDKKKMKE